MSTTQDLANQLVKILQTEAQGFLDDHAEDVSMLGEEVVSWIFQDQILAVTPIPALPREAPPEVIADREEVLKHRANLNQLIAKAQLENAVRIQKLKDAARERAIKIGSGVLGVAIAALKGLVGG